MKDAARGRARMAVMAGLMAVSCASGTAAQQPDAVFRIGMVSAAGDAPVVDGLSLIRQAFSAALGQPVEVIAARDYAALIEAHIGGRVDYALYSAPAYAAATIRCLCLQPVAFPLGEEGAIGVRSVLIARRGAAMRTVALGAADSLTGRLAPMALWPQAAEMARQDRLVLAESASEAEAMFLEGRVDGFFGWAPAWEDDAAPAAGGTLDRLGPADAGYEIAWRSAPLRHGPHAVSADASVDTLARLRRMLTGLGPERGDLRAALGGSRSHGFAAAVQEDYAPVVEALEALVAK